MTMDPASNLRRQLRAEINGPIDPEIAVIAKQARDPHGSDVCAVLFYGSCLRRGYQDGDVVDLYLVIDDYRIPSVSRASAFLNWLLPPNVIYLEADYRGKIVRAKCAIISMKDFERGVSGKWFHSYLWARFAQPCRLI